MNRSTAAAALLFLAACSSSEEKDPPPTPPPVVVETFQDAGTLLGQADWDEAAPGACTASALTDPYGGVGWDGTQLLVPDSFSGRLLAFSPIPGPEADPLTAPAASWAIGEPDATTCNDAAGTLWIPQAPTVSSTGRLVVSDSGLAQVLVYDEVPNDSGATASLVPFGQYAATGCAGGMLNDPRGAILVDGKLLVADAGNHRVLVYDVTNNGVPLLVLGQVESASLDPFDNCAYNDTDGDGIAGASGGGDSPDASTLSFPTAVWSDGTVVVVADTDNHRVLVWSTFPTVSGQPADVVLGQASATASTPGTGAARLASPQSVASDGEQLFVADTGNHRVLVYPAIPAVDGASATIVLGQGDFAAAHVAPNDDDQDGLEDAAPTARTLSSPTGVAVVGNLLAITDTGNGRVVIHRPPAAP